MPLQALRGTTDVLGDAVSRWSVVEHTAHRLARLYGYQEIRTPLIEEASLFLRSVGETTDLVQKEMFRFEDRGGHDIVLRPEGTASVVRAYLEHHLHKTQGFAKLYYLGPMFRAERPQAGRFRQFHQYGVEAIGSESPWVDVEVIALSAHILRECGVANSIVWLSSMGCRKDQQRSAQLLRKRLRKDRAKLCKECQARFEKNVFRVLDCKNPVCHEIAWRSKESPFVLCEACAAHFDEVRRGLREAGVPFDDTKVFARGLDYYTRTVFEIRAKGLGAQDAVAAGGRYDHLVEELGGPSVGAVGFAAGIERVLLALEHAKPATEAGTPTGGRRGSPAPQPSASGSSLRDPERTRGIGEAAGTRRGLYLATAQPALISEGFRVVQQLRARGVFAVMDYDSKSLKAQLREADKAGAHLVAILGQAELAQRAMALKDLEQGSQENVAFDEFVDTISQRLKPSCP